ncbi:hypothetical protein [Nocardia ignorata]|nr:hypothetical protein [Nocardia ignorata]
MPAAQRAEVCSSGRRRTAVGLTQERGGAIAPMMSFLDPAS